MSPSTSDTPAVSKWDLALDGIAELGHKIDGLGERLERQQGELQDLRAYAIRTAPMSVFMGLENRVVALETGATAAILGHLQADLIERKERQTALDARARADARRTVWLIVVLSLVVVALAGLAAALVWVATYG